MNGFKSQRAGREGAGADGQILWCTGSICKEAALSLPVHLIPVFCSPAACLPSWRNPCPEYHRTNCILAAVGTHLVAVAGGGFVPDDWAVIGLVSVGRVDPAENGVLAFLCHCSCGIIPVLFLVCSQLLVVRTGFTVGLGEAVATQVSRSPLP